MIDLASEIEAASKRYPEVSFAKLSRIAKRFYELGRKDMKEQMMQEAVEANVIATKCGDKYQQLLITDWNSLNDLLNGDKVRIIIVKED